MNAAAFRQAVDAIVARDPRFAAGGYYFLKEALDFTVRRVRDDDESGPRHVTGPELLEGFRDHALEQFGPLAATLLARWNIRSCADVGEMVFLLIEARVFGKQETDTKDDFRGVYDFHDAFVAPFLPRRRRQPA
jgi:uncharacterized repeat protein (TIGR04138 family)